MIQLRFDGRTAIVTGAGGNPSLGRAHAMLLAARGANVVVNDINRDPEAPGYYNSPASAQAVVDEIRALGGKAVADTNSVATEEGAKAIVQTALDTFGGVDILVNNAVTGVIKPFDEYTTRDITRQIDVGLMGPIWMCRAAWPHMRAKGYGRIVNISSSAMTGAGLLTLYGTAKGGVFSLTRGLAAEGGEFGIKVNTVNPGGFTRGAQATIEESSTVYQQIKEHLPPELVSPVIAFLAHESCPVSGESIDASGGSVRRFYIAQTQGFVDTALTIETVAARWNDVLAGTAESAVSYNQSPTKGVLKKTKT